MDERWTHLLSKLRERFPADTDVTDVEAFLSSEGYDRREIGEIVSAWAADLSPERTARPSGRQTSMPFRVMGPHERGRFSTEAWGYLLSMAGAGLMNVAELETAIERAMSQVEGRIALDDLRSLMDSGGYDDFGPPPDHVTIH
jgi:Smg protein